MGKIVQCGNGGGIGYDFGGTKSEGIMEAISQMKLLNLKKRIRYEYEMRLKAKRDRWAEDDYIREETKTAIIRNMLAQDMPVTQICQIAECDEAYVEEIRNKNAL